MRKTYNSIRDYFLPNQPLADELKTWQARVVISFILTMLVFGIVLWLTVICDLVQDEFPFHIFLPFTLLLLFIFKSTGKFTPIVLVLCFSIIILNHFNITATGAIYSYNLRWNLIPILMCFLFLSPRNSLVVISFIFGFIIYIYSISTELDATIAMQISKQNYLFDNISFLVVVSLQVFIFYRAQKFLNDSLIKKTSELEEQKILLQEKSNRLDQLSQELQTSNDALNNYAHTTAHDLKQPVRSIASYTQLAERELRKNGVTDKVFSNLDFVKKSSIDLSKMIENLLQIAKVDYDFGASQEGLNLETNISKITSNLSTQLESSDTKIKINDIPCVKGNATQIERVLMNLISNAIKYAKQDVNPEIEISGKVLSNKMIQIEVKDNGLGIPEHLQKDIFTKFNQVDGESKIGHGIGLAICKEIVEAHDGKIWVESDLGIGSTFKFTLPPF